jgi:glycine/D-amino acid oxidase-like deaminating enzyme
LDAGHPGSSWGETRISRLAYEEPHFVRLMQRGFVLWDELAKETGRTLLKRCPCLDVGDIASESLKNLTETYRALGLAYEELSAAEVPMRFPQIQLPSHERAVLQKEAGVLLASECLDAIYEAAESRGAEWFCGEAVVAIDRRRKVVTTEDGKDISYSKLVLCCGAWTNKLLQLSGLPLMPIVVSNEQNLYYDKSTGNELSYDVDSDMPIVIEHFPPTGGAKDQGIYVIPHVGGIPGIKVGEHRVGTLLQNDDFIVREDSLQRLHLIPTRSKEFQDVRGDDVDVGPKARCDSFVAQHFPGVCPDGSHHIRCLYSQTTLDDEDFIVGVMPTDPDVFLACGFAGEGFKFGVAIGEFVMQLLTKAQLSVPDVLERFSVARAL